MLQVFRYSSVNRLSRRLISTTGPINSTLSTHSTELNGINYTTTNSSDHVNDNNTISQEIIDTFRKENSVTIRGVKTTNYVPVLDFDSSPFDQVITSLMKREGFPNPTPIQSEAWPALMQKRDMISVSRTGSGKTLGYLLPAFQLVSEQRAKNKKNDNNVEEVSYSKVRGRGSRLVNSKVRNPSVLVLAPTRELTQQIEKEAHKYASLCRIKTVSVYGGAGKIPQINEIRNGVDIVIATPGRCNDLAEMGVLNLSQISFFVLDEADRMLDMGFEPQLRQILELLPKSDTGNLDDAKESGNQKAIVRQTACFTATWPIEVQKLAQEFVENPIQINIGNSDTLNANKAIKQHVHVVKGFEKEEKLLELLDSLCVDPNNPDMVNTHQMPKTIIFVNKRLDCEHLYQKLREQGFTVGTLHGDKAQAMRTKTMDQFRSNKMKILVATDVAARGLDVKDIQYVVNYDFPTNVEDYVHRIGRTARGNMEGTAHTFLTKKDTSSHLLTQLIGIMKRAEQDIPQELLALQDNLGGNSNRGGARNRYGMNNNGSRYGNNSYGNNSSSSDYGTKNFGNNRNTSNSNPKFVDKYKSSYENFGDKDNNRYGRNSRDKNFSRRWDDDVDDFDSQRGSRRRN